MTSSFSTAQMFGLRPDVWEDAKKVGAALGLPESDFDITQAMEDAANAAAAARVLEQQLAAQAAAAEAQAQRLAVLETTTSILDQTMHQLELGAITREDAAAIIQESLGGGDIYEALNDNKVTLVDEIVARWRGQGGDISDLLDLMKDANRLTHGQVNQDRIPMLDTSKLSLAELSDYVPNPTFHPEGVAIASDPGWYRVANNDQYVPAGCPELYALALRSNRCRPFYTSQRVPVRPGDVLWVQAWVSCFSSSSGDFAFGVASSDQPRGGVFSPVAQGPRMRASEAVGKWTLREWQFRVPEGSRSFVEPYLDVEPSEGNTWLVTGWHVRRVVPEAQIAALTPGKIAGLPASMQQVVENAAGVVANAQAVAAAQQAVSGAAAAAEDARVKALAAGQSAAAADQAAKDAFAKALLAEGAASSAQSTANAAQQLAKLAGAKAFDLVPNPSFDPAVLPLAASATSTQVVPQGAAGVPAGCPASHCIRIGYGQNDPYGRDAMTFPVVAGDNIYVSAMVANVSATVGLDLILAMYKADQSVSYSLIARHPSSRAWARVEGVFTIPSNVVKAALYINTGDETNTWHLTDWHVARVVPQSQLPNLDPSKVITLPGRLAELTTTTSTANAAANNATSAGSSAAAAQAAASAANVKADGLESWRLETGDPGIIEAKNEADQRARYQDVPLITPLWQAPYGTDDVSYPIAEIEYNGTSSGWQYPVYKPDADEHLIGFIRSSRSRTYDRIRIACVAASSTPGPIYVNLYQVVGTSLRLRWASGDIGANLPNATKFFDVEMPPVNAAPGDVFAVDIFQSGASRRYVLAKARITGITAPNQGVFPHQNWGAFTSTAVAPSTVSSSSVSFTGAWSVWCALGSSLESDMTPTEYTDRFSNNSLDRQWTVYGNSPNFSNGAVRVNGNGAGFYGNVNKLRSDNITVTGILDAPLTSGETGLVTRITADMCNGVLARFFYKSGATTVYLSKFENSYNPSGLIWTGSGSGTLTHIGTYSTPGQATAIRVVADGDNYTPQAYINRAWVSLATTSIPGFAGNRYAGMAFRWAFDAAAPARIDSWVAAAP